MSLHKRAKNTLTSVIGNTLGHRDPTFCRKGKSSRKITIFGCELVVTGLCGFLYSVGDDLCLFTMIHFPFQRVDMSKCPFND